MNPTTHAVVGVVTIILLLFIMSLLRRRQLRSKYALLWLSVGIGLLPLAVVPDILLPVSRFLGIAYEPATLLFTGMAFLLMVVVHFSWELSRLEERSRVLAEEVAMLRARTD